MFSKDGLDAIDTSADEDDCDELISVNFTDFQYNFTESPIFFSPKHQMILLDIYVFPRKKQSSLYQG